MAWNTTEVGLRPVPTAGVTTPASINASTTLTVPTTAQRMRGGVMECVISVEGTSNARYTWNGVVPTAAIGLQFVVPGTLTLVGEEMIAAFKIIGTAAGDTITYNFGFRDTR